MSTVQQAAQMRLRLDSNAENVTIVRQALSGFAKAVSLAQIDLNDIVTAVTEACNNVSLHAYGDEQGLLEVELRAWDAAIVVTVRDRGIGLGLRNGVSLDFPTDVDGELIGIGMPSITALAQTARWSEPADGGTKVEMTFSTSPLSWEGSSLGVRERLLASEPEQFVAGGVEVTMTPTSVARSVLPRLLRVMASRAGFSVERHADVQRVATVVLGVDASNWITRGVEARLKADRDSLQVAIGPMSEEDASQLSVAAHAMEPKLCMSIERLGDGPRRLVVHL
jgi:serine/threonine-protein kinase RsbW